MVRVESPLDLRGSLRKVDKSRLAVVYQSFASVFFYSLIDRHLTAISPRPRVCYYNSTRMVCHWSISDFTTVHLFVVDYQIF